VVITIISAALTMGYQLLQSIWSSQLAGTSSRDINSIVQFAQKKSLSNGKTLILEFNLDKRFLGLKELDTTSSEEFLDAMEVGINNAPDDDADEEKEENKTEWISERVDIPVTLLNIYNVSGQQLKGPIVNISFYPDGTSDPFIIEYERESNPYEYIPRYPIDPVPLSTITSDEDEEEKEGIGE